MILILQAPNDATSGGAKKQLSFLILPQKMPSGGPYVAFQNK